MDDDLVLERDGATVLIDPVSLDFLAGREIDFIDDLIGQAFKVNNPNATSSCGCGTSFLRLNENRHLERQFDQGAAGAGAGLAEGGQAGCRLPAGNQMRRREFSRASRSRRWAIIAPYTDRRPITASPSCPSAAGRCHPAPARRRRRRSCPLSRSGGHRRQGRAAGGLDLCAQRQSHRHRQIHLQAGLAGAAAAPARRNCWRNEEPVALMGDFNVIPEDEDCYDPKAWVNDALFQPESRAALRRIEYLGYTDAFRALPSRGRTIHLLGLSGRRLAARTTASASTTSCCRPRPPTGSRPAGSTSMCGRQAKSRRTMCRSGCELDI